MQIRLPGKSVEQFMFVSYFSVFPFSNSRNLQVTADHLHYMFRKTLVVRDITILSVRVVPNKGYAFVQFSRHAEARFAIEVCNGLMICGRRIKVHLAFAFDFCNLFV